MPEALPLTWILAAPASAALTWLAVLYGRRRGLLDLPGRRRSHREVTPRGGGIGPVLVVLLALPIVTSAAEAPALALALALVAAVGWIDDHRPLSAGLRLAVHALAAVVLVPGLLPGLGGIGLVLAGLGLVAAVNVSNFMDGINGLTASQAALVSVAIAVLSGPQLPVPGGLAAVVALACAGFLPFNLPRARVFLGDVGSGALGLLAGALGLLAWREGMASAAALLLLPSAFALDAGLTLLARARAGRRLAQPHREHLYQWLVRAGASHTSVTAAYAGWTLLMAGLCLAFPRGSMALTVAVYLAGAGIWWQARRALLARRRRRGR